MYPLWSAFLRRCAFLWLIPAASGMIFFTTGDATHNTTAPGGDFTGSGWQWVGEWIGFQGTPVGPRHFLAAAHIGGSVGDVFVFRGLSYTTVAMADDPASDLRLWKVDRPFPDWAPLYRSNGELLQRSVVFGRGLQRGAEVRVGGLLRGWRWGAYDGQLRWGTNTVVQLRVHPADGELLQCAFSAGPDPNEAHLALFDSSAPSFIHDGSGWKLAGLAYSVDAKFSLVGGSDAGFDAAIFDARGLYFGSAGQWQLISGTGPVASSFYSTRVSARLEWIDSILAESATPVPSTPPGLVGIASRSLSVAALVALGLRCLSGRRPRREV